MTAARPADILRRLEPPAAPDAELLALFARTRDASAFAELVRRHGPLVLGVCRRVTGNAHDAEDAFQASFLVLAQKAGTLSNAALLGNWLYGVAVRVASRAKRAAARRRAREVTVPTLPDPPAPEPRAALPELGSILDEELAALAAHYRDAIVLCDLRGLSREEAAEALGVPEGTLSSRLANGRKKLAARLARRGVALPAAGLSAALGTATASVPAELLARTCETVTDWAATGTVPGALAALTKGGLTMRLSLLFGSVLALGITGAVFAALPASAPPVPPKPPVLARADDKKPDEPRPGAKAEAKPALGAPRLGRTIDVPALQPLGLVWNAKGTHVALSGAQSNDKLKQWQPAFRLISPDEPTNGILGTGAPNEFLLAPTSDGKGYVTILREDSLISGRHRLAFWAYGTTKFGTTGYSVARTVSLDPARAFQYTLTEDEKAYRAVLALDGGLADAPRFEVIEAGTKDGEPQKSLLKLEAGTVVLSAGGTRAAHLSENGTTVTVYDVDSAKKLSACALEQPKRSAPSRDWYVLLSPDGSRLLAWNGLGRAHVFDTTTGNATPLLEGAKIVELYKNRASFSGDGRLFACLLETYREYVQELVVTDGKKVTETRYRSAEQQLAVWSTETGKLLKSWKTNGGLYVAFSPTRPVLAVAEQNGENAVRVGFWDFAAEVKK